MDGIELDDIQVVNVTGKDHKDKSSSKRKGSCWSLSLRVRTILLFVSIAIVFGLLLIFTIRIFVVFTSYVRVCDENKNNSGWCSCFDHTDEGYFGNA